MLPEAEIVQAIKALVKAARSPITIGGIGTLLAHIEYHISSDLKSKYGGLKKFIELHDETFVLDTDHPTNPTITLRKPPTAARPTEKARYYRVYLTTVPVPFYQGTKPHHAGCFISFKCSSLPIPIGTATGYQRFYLPDFPLQLYGELK